MAISDLCPPKYNYLGEPVERILRDPNISPDCKHEILQRLKGLEMDYLQRYTPMPSAMAEMFQAMVGTPKFEKAHKGMGLIDMIKHRLRTPDSSKFFDYWDAARVADTVHVFVITGNESVILKDDWAMFPSDSLITQLRVLENR
ncbi:MAG TPA: hypothetical protein VKT73_15375 [Xanthobacteraceae bacterium]|nr:hypothetical protein [Xanthobacteraceae bacterium]